MFENLENPPDRSDSFFWTDFVELRALIHPDKCYSRGDFSGLAKRLRDTGNNRSFNEDLRWRELINFAEIRENDFKEFYPFKASDDGDTLIFEFGDSPEQNVYLALLTASLMRNISPRRRNELARHFELICFKLFSKLVPVGSEIRATWANGGSEAPYIGRLPEKMRQIAGDIRCTPNFKDRDFHENDTGDGNIDIIAWHPMADSREGIPISFAQCGCSKEDWKFKQLEASFAKHGRNLPVMHPWSTYYFLPIDLRFSDGDWAYKSDIGAAIIVDRLRIAKLYKQFNLLSEMPVSGLLQEAKQFNYLY